MKTNKLTKLHKPSNKMLSTASGIHPTKMMTNFKKTHVFNTFQTVPSDIELLNEESFIEEDQFINDYLRGANG